MRVGEKVKVYLDPLTCENLEGEGKLIRKYNVKQDDPAIEVWMIDIDGNVVLRQINLENH